MVRAAALAKTTMVLRSIVGIPLERDGVDSTDKTVTIVCPNCQNRIDASPPLSSCDGRRMCSRTYFDWRYCRASWRRLADSFMAAYSHFARRCCVISDASAACSALCTSHSRRPASQRWWNGPARKSASISRRTLTCCATPAASPSLTRASLPWTSHHSAYGCSTCVCFAQFEVPVRRALNGAVARARKSGNLQKSQGAPTA
jgi:hypothetical protein